MPSDIALAPLLSALFAACSVLAAVASYQVNRKGLAAKLIDRLYELDKLIIANPAAFATFMEQATRPDTDFFRTSARDETYYRVKAFTYFYLNLFDEIYAAYGRTRHDFDETWTAWENYIFARMKHPLLKEVVSRECALTARGNTVVPERSSVFTAGFVRFLCDNYEQWSGRCDPDAW